MVRPCSAGVSSGLRLRGRIGRAVRGEAPGQASQAAPRTRQDLSPILPAAQEVGAQEAGGAWGGTVIPSRPRSFPCPGRHAARKPEVPMRLGGALLIVVGLVALV